MTYPIVKYPIVDVFPVPVMTVVNGGNATKFVQCSLRLDVLIHFTEDEPIMF